jgi:thymidine kinase
MAPAADMCGVAGLQTTSRVILAIGPMFAGKSTYVLNFLQQLPAGTRVAAIKPALDDRYGRDEIVTHDGLRRRCLPVASMSEVDIADYDVIGVDEGQFLPDLPDFCMNLLREHPRGKTVVVALLKGDFRAEPWEVTSRLLPIASEARLFCADCDVCGEPGCAAYTLRRANNRASKIQVGGADTYQAACGSCYFRNFASLGQ